VLYGDRNNWFAAYTYWYLNYYGHRNVKLINGPREKWIAEARPTTAELPSHLAVEVEPHPDQRPAAGLGGDVDALGDATHEREPEAEAGAVVARRHAGPLIGNRQQQRLAVLARLEVDLPARLAAVPVHDAVRDNLRDREEDVRQRSRIGADPAQEVLYRVACDSRGAVISRD
jgi:hypothetical protein